MTVREDVKERLPRKLILCGDCHCGKSALINVIASGNMTPRVNVFPPFYKELVVAGQEIRLDLWDTNGREEYQRLRIMSYPGTHVVMLCFAVDNRESFDNAIHQWLDEVREHCSYAKVVLSGLKCDLRNDEATLQRLKKNEQLPISYEEGLAAAKNIKADHYFECSALQNTGIDECVEQVAKTAMSVITKYDKKKRQCMIL